MIEGERRRWMEEKEREMESELRVVREDAEATVASLTSQLSTERSTREQQQHQINALKNVS